MGAAGLAHASPGRAVGVLCMSATSVMGQRDPCGLGHRQVVLLAPPRLRTRGDYHPQPVGVGGFLSPPGRWQRHRGAGCLRPPSPPPPKSPSGCWPWAGRKKNTKKQQQQQQQQQQQAWQGYTLPPPWRLLGPIHASGVDLGVTLGGVVLVSAVVVSGHATQVVWTWTGS